MALAIFDLDNTLLAGDSDYLWGEYLVAKKLVDISWFAAENQRFLDEYNAGTLHIQDWLDFQLQPLKDNPMRDLHIWREDFLETIIKPIVLSKGLAKIAEHKTQGDTVLIVTATNSFVTRPIAEFLAIETLIATEPEIKDWQYTGKTIGTITFQEGKITALESWMGEHGFTCDNCWFYSDSHNDAPLLRHVAHPVAVDPDDKLRAEAEQSNWQILSFR